MPLLRAATSDRPTRLRSPVSRCVAGCPVFDTYLLECGLTLRREQHIPTNGVCYCTVAHSEGFVY